MREIKLIALVILFIFPYTSNAQEVWIDSIQYKLIPKGNAAEVINCCIQSEEVILPSTIACEGETYNVITIASRAFKNKSYKSIQLPKTLTGIGGEAFYCCHFVSISIPNNVKTIASKAFEGCRQLESISLGEGLEYIGDKAFKDCILLSTIVFPEQLRTIGLEAFKGCRSLRNVTIGKGLELINANAFSLTSIDTVHISDLNSWCKVQYNDAYEEYISNPLDGACLYINNEKITDLVIQGSIKEISKHVFRGCKDLKSVTVQGGVNVIGEGAFYGCKSLSEVKLPTSLTSIINVFNNCDALKNITIPEGVKEIDDFNNNPNLTSVLLPNSLLSIGGFQKCTSLMNIVLPAKLEKINQYAFSDCSSLLSLSVPSKVSEIGRYAFSNCTSLESLTIESGVGYIGYYTFSNCEKLINVYLDAERYENMAFDNCNEIKTIYLGSNTKKLAGIFKNSEKIEDVYCYATEVPDGGDSFLGSYIQYITLHVPEVSIENYKQAFPWNQFKEIIAIGGIPINTEIEMDGIKYKAISYTEVEVAHKDDYSGDIVIPENVSINDKVYKVTSIGKKAFYSDSNGGCKITSIQIPSGVTSIGRSAFSRCELLKEVKLPDDIICLDSGTFSGCSSLESIALPRKLQEIKYAAFSDGCGLKSIEIPNQVFRIGGFAFQRNKSLKTVITSNGLKEIYYYAFSYCDSLQTVVLGDNVEKIGCDAFGLCSQLSRIYSLNPTPPALNQRFDNGGVVWSQYIEFDNTFGWGVNQNATLYVPIGSKEAYRNDGQWGKFKNIVEFDPNTLDPSTLGIKSIKNNEEEMKYYSLDGRILSSPSKGLNIIKMKNGTIKKVLIK